MRGTHVFDPVCLREERTGGREERTGGREERTGGREGRGKGKREGEMEGRNVVMEREL